jgi:hypothetical protein
MLLDALLDEIINLAGSAERATQYDFEIGCVECDGVCKRNHTFRQRLSHYYGLLVERGGLPDIIITLQDSTHQIFIHRGAIPGVLDGKTECLEIGEWANPKTDPNIIIHQIVDTIGLLYEPVPRKYRA